MKMSLQSGSVALGAALPGRHGAAAQHRAALGGGRAAARGARRAAPLLRAGAVRREPAAPRRARRARRLLLAAVAAASRCSGEACINPGGRYIYWNKLITCNFGGIYEINEFNNSSEIYS